jgi:ABC-2 type transport system ATP-binding protein
MAYVPDNPELYENMKAIDFINFICDMYEIPFEEREKNINKYAKLFEIENNLNDTINSFSHGMKQKIAIISALAHNPKILIMDEPFVGLDPKAVYDIKEIMKEIKTLEYNDVVIDDSEEVETENEEDTNLDLE